MTGYEALSSKVRCIYWSAEIYGYANAEKVRAERYYFVYKLMYIKMVGYELLSSNVRCVY